MKRLIISLVIEGEEDVLAEIKSDIIKNACPALVSVSMNEIDVPKKQIEVPVITG